MKSYLLVIASYILIFSNCKPEPVKVPTEPVFIGDSALKIVWKIPIGYKSVQYEFVKFYNNIVAFSLSDDDKSFSSAFFGLDKKTGRIIWTFRKFLNIDDVCQENDILYFRADGEVFAFSITKGDVLWHVKIPGTFTTDGPLNFEGNRLWKTWCVGDSTLVYSINPISGELTKIKAWHMNQNDLFKYQFNKIGLWMHPNGDSILLLTSRSLKTTKLPNNVIDQEVKPDFIAWNLNNDSLYFELKDFKDFYDIGTPVVLGNDMIVTDQSYMTSINLITKKMNWFLVLSSFAIDKNLTYNNGFILTHPHSGYSDDISWIDASNGKVIKTLTENSWWFSNYHFNNNYMYFCNRNTIKKVDVTVPKIIWEFKSSIKDQNSFGFNNNIALDMPNDLLYTMDNDNFYCFKIMK